MICCELRILPLIQHFSRLVKRSRFIFTRLIPMLLRFTSRQHSTPNRKKRSSSSSVRTGTSSHGILLTCRVFPGGWLSTVYESTQSETCQRISSTVRRPEEKGHWRGGGSALSSGVYPRDLPLRVARQCCHGPQEGRFTSHVH